MQSSQAVANKKQSVPLREKVNIKALSINQRMEYLYKIKVWYAKLQKIEESISYCHNSFGSSTPMSMSLFGPERVGKTHLIEQYCNKYPRVEKECLISLNASPKQPAKVTVIPVLYVRMPCPANIGGLVGAMLQSLGHPILSYSGSIYDKTRTIYTLLNFCQVELLIFDEVQHFVDRDRQKLMMTSSDWLKNLIDETKIPVVLIGTKESQMIFNNRQLNGRFYIRKELNPLSFTNQDCFWYNENQAFRNLKNPA